MPLGTDPESRAAGSLAAVGMLIIQDCRSRLRGKKDSVRPPGIHKPQCTRWHDDENLASRGLRSDLNRVPVSILGNPAR